MPDYPAVAEVADGLLRLPVDGHSAEREAALRTLDGAQARCWLGFDESLRSRWQWDPHPRWPITERVARDALDALDVLDVVLTGCHPDGRIREAVLPRLGALRRPAAATVLAIRTCDWAGPVRDLARGGVDAWLPAADERCFAALAEAATALRTRIAGKWLVARIDAHVAALPAERLEPLLRLPDTRTRRVAYRAAVARDLLDADRLVAAATKDRDQPIRVMAARAAVARASDLAALHRLSASGTALVRAEALTALIAHGALTAAVTALPDRHPVVRAVAQDAVRAVGTDPAAHYRSLIAGGSIASSATLSGPTAGAASRPGAIAGEAPRLGASASAAPRPGAIAGLGETGGPDDAAAVRGQLRHPAPRGRVEALRALRRLGCLTADDAVGLLADPSTAVVRQAVAALRPSAATLDASLLDGLLGPEQPPHLRFAGWQLTRERGPWPRLIVDLRLLDDADERLSGAARTDIGSWLAQAPTLYRMPTAAQRADLAALIDRAAATLGRTAKLLRFHAGLT